jgi:hypothetical protein
MKVFVIDQRNEKVIDLFTGETARKKAKTLRDDFGSYHHCVRPRIVESDLDLRPGDPFPKS